MLRDVYNRFQHRLWHRDSASADLFSRGRSNQILHYKAWYVRTYSSGHLRHPKGCSEYYAAINSRLTHPWLHDCSLTAAHLSRRPTVVLAVQLRLKNLGQLIRWWAARQEADFMNPAMVVEKSRALFFLDIWIFEHMFSLCIIYRLLTY